MAFGKWYPWQIITRRAGIHLTHTFEESFDVARLQSELAAVLEHHDIVPHYRSYLASGWGAITLVGPHGKVDEHRSVAVVKGETVEYSRTPAMDHAPYMESILSMFPGKHNRVRLMRLEAGRKIFWHHDGFLFGLDRKIARFHIPIITNPGVQLQVGHEDCRWSAGGLFFLDNSFPHRLVNAGAQDRIHLVFDMEVSPELLDMFPAEFAEQVQRRIELRERCRSWIDNSLGRVYQVQKRWQMKRQKLQELLSGSPPAKPGSAEDKSEDLAQPAQSASQESSEKSPKILQG